MPSVIAETEAALNEGKSVVISLVGTGEARTKEQVAKATANGGMLEDLDFSPREVIAAMVDRGFPTTLYQDVTDPGTGRTIQVPVKDGKGNAVQSKEALRMKQEAIDGLSALELPENPLDQLVNHFGERNVAELTGRTRRLIRDSQGRVEYKKRNPEGVAMHRTNVHEMAQFQLRKKRVAIISDAAAMGISLHASNRAENRQRRVHVTLELGWSADKQMQTFGRTHRSDQAMPPEYVLLSTELGGEKRFSSTIARRLGSLGALTKGDRRSADSGDLAKYNFETEEGRAALCLMLRRIVESGNVPGLANPRQTLRDIGLLVRNRDGCEEVRKDDLYNVPRFLNRVLAVDVDHQNALFDHFVDLFDQTVRYAKANGTFDEGVTDIKALAIRIAKPHRVVHIDEITNAQTTHYTLEIDVPSKAVSFYEAERVRKRKTGAFFRHRKNRHFILAIESGLHTNAENGNSYRTFAVWKPEAARSTYIHDDELKDKYRAVIPSKARDWWIEKHASVPPIETHETHIIGGAIIPLWQRFKTHEEARLRVVRVTTDDGQRIVGIRIPQEQVGPIVAALGATRDLRDPEEIFTGILDEGEEVTLVSGLKLCRKVIHREPAIELIGVDPYRFAEVRSLGLINEQIDWKQRFFVPTDEEAGVAVLTELLARYPVMVSDAFADDESALVEIEPSELAPPQIVDLDEWFISVATPEPTSEPESSVVAIAKDIEDAEFGLTLPAFYFARRSDVPRDVEEIQLALDFG
ncbi:MAG TPA: strawberry notch C-terminal domain-containing protein [Pyrinomonadaceae bacterium]|nr:strawberry notch C-terminal domain-containing protein [Pyrinomonadaceae bacterium]